MDSWKRKRICIRKGILTAAVVVLFSQCSPHAGKSVLRFFFDGVPETDSTVTAGAVGVDSLAGSAVLTEQASFSRVPGGMLHYPYEEQDCAACHNELSLGSMVEPQPGLCYICHEDLAASYNYLHGPVAGGYCTACHDPHRSEHEHLLKLEGDDLCFFCHTEASVLENEMHRDLEGMSCMDCHNPHGGDDKYIFQ